MSVGRLALVTTGPVSGRTRKGGKEGEDGNVTVRAVTFCESNHRPLPAVRKASRKAPEVCGVSKYGQIVRTKLLRMDSDAWRGNAIVEENDCNSISG